MFSTQADSVLNDCAFLYMWNMTALNWVRKFEYKYTDCSLRHVTLHTRTLYFRVTLRFWCQTSLSGCWRSRSTATFSQSWPTSINTARVSACAESFVRMRGRGKSMMMRRRQKLTFDLWTNEHVYWNSSRRVTVMHDVDDDTACDEIKQHVHLWFCNVLLPRQRRLCLSSKMYWYHDYVILLIYGSCALWNY